MLGVVLPRFAAAQGTFPYLVKIYGTPKPGSGFVVALRDDVATVVTASHVIMGAQKFEVAFADALDRRFPVDSTSDFAAMETDDIHGLAAFWVRGALPSSIAALPLDVETTLSFEDEKDLFFVGFPNRASLPSRINGRFGGRDGSRIKFDRPAGEGASGSPLIRDGKAVGLVTAADAHFTYAVNARVIREILRGWAVILSDQAGQIIFEERFDESSSYWPGFFVDAEARAEIREGHLLLGSRAGEWYFQVVPVALNQNDDFKIECTAQKLAGADNSLYGLIWGMKDSDNFFTLVISGDGRFVVSKKEVGKVADYLQSFFVSPHIKRHNSINTLAVEKRGDRLGLYINGHSVFTIQFEPFFGQYVGFVVYNSIQLAFDDLTVTVPTGRPSPGSPRP
jgi:hypothetical protein